MESHEGCSELVICDHGALAGRRPDARRCELRFSERSGRTQGKLSNRQYDRVGREVRGAWRCVPSGGQLNLYFIDVHLPDDRAGVPGSTDVCWLLTDWFSICHC